MRWMALFFLLFSLLFMHTIIAAKESRRLPIIALDTARRGQDLTYRLLGELLERSGTGFKVVKFKGIDELLALHLTHGDTILVNAYSDLYGQSHHNPKMQQLKESGVQIILDLEITRFNTLFQNDFALFRSELYDKIVSSSLEVITILNGHNVPNVIYANHLETLYLKYLQESEEKTTLLYLDRIKTDPGQKRILFIEQFDYKGSRAVKDFLKKYASRKNHDQILLALHPYSDSYKYDYLLYGEYSGLDIRMFKSGQRIKSSALLPYVDGVISVASTLVDVAKMVGIPTYSDPDETSYEYLYTGIDDFLNSLTAQNRDSNRLKLRPIGEETLIQWEKILTSQMRGIHFHDDFFEYQKFYQNCGELLAAILNRAVE